MPRIDHYLLALLMSAVLAIPALAQNAGLKIGEKAMLDPQTIADRYVAVWNEADEKRRRDAISALWVPNGQHFVEGRQARGYEELEKRVRGSYEKNVRDNGNRFRAAAGARRLHDVITFHWEMLPANDDTVLVRGLEFLIINEEGRILIDYQFFPAEGMIRKAERDDDSKKESPRSGQTSSAATCQPDHDHPLHRSLSRPPA